MTFLETTLIPLNVVGGVKRDGLPTRTRPSALGMPPRTAKTPTAHRSGVNVGYLTYALVALASYTMVSPLTKLATRDLPSDAVAAVTNGMLAVAAFGLVLWQGDSVTRTLTHPDTRYVLAAGIFLSVGIIAYYRAIKLGPVSVVVPIFGLFLVTSSIIGILFLDEALTLRKGLGITLAVVAVVLVSGE
jgi:transporter family protein